MLNYNYTHIPGTINQNQKPENATFRINKYLFLN